MERIQAYDINKQLFRDVIEENNSCGIVYFNRSALSVIENYSLICGFFIIDKGNKTISLIDVQDNLIGIDEFTFFNLSLECKNELKEYNVVHLPTNLFSYSFLCLYNENDIITLKNTDTFAYFCYKIVKDIKWLRKFVLQNISIYFPNTNLEIYTFAQRLYDLTNFDYVNPDYESKFKYVIDALLNGYHINMNESEIEEYAINISHLALQELEK